MRQIHRKAQGKVVVKTTRGNHRMKLVGSAVLCKLSQKIAGELTRILNIINSRYFPPERLKFMI